MSKSTSNPRGSRSGHGPRELCPFDTEKFENILQLAGIRTGSLDSVPSAAGGGTQSCRVAFFDTGAGLRFTVNLDRGGDIVEASCKQHNLAYLTPNGHRTPSHAYHSHADWLRGWPGGLLTSCGPNYFGPPRVEDGHTLGVHGHHSNTPAGVEMLLNPDPHRGRNAMLLAMVIRDSRMFGPVIEVRRTIQCRLGVNEIVLYDEIINRASTRCAHNWLYHFNLGYPLVDAGAKLIFKGKTQYLGGEGNVNAKQINGFKTVTPPLEIHRGTGERVLLVDNEPDSAGICHAGLINPKLSLALELSYPAESLPRFANWQHFGPGGSYVTGLEPFSGSLLGKEKDTHPKAAQWLEPGESKRYQLTIKVHDEKNAIKALASQDGPLSL